MPREMSREISHERMHCETREWPARAVRYIGRGSAMSPSAEQIVLEAAKSAELRAEFDRLRWATDLGQQPKFTPQVCDKLATLVVTRCYASQLLQLCHLVCVARLLAGESGYLFFFMELDSARSDRFRSRLAELITLAPSEAQRPEASIELRGDGVEIGYPDGSFVVHFRQMPLLTALLELCVNALELAAVDAIFEEMLEGGVTASKVSRAANGVAALFYAYLKRNLPAVQEQRKHRHLIAFMCERCGEAFGAAEIDDAAVLDFWCREAGMENSFGTDFRLYKTAASAFIHLRATLEQGRELYALARPDSLGHRVDEGEVDPGGFEAAAFALDGDQDDASPAHLRPWAIEGVVQSIDGDESPLARLAEPPLCRVKFLNEQERKELGAIVDSGEQACAMPLTLLRSDVFDPVQRRIGRASGSRLQKMLAEVPNPGYAERQQRLDGLLLHLNRVAATVAQVIGGDDSGDEGEATGTLVDMELMKRARSDFKRPGRIGFDAASLSDPGIVDVFRAATGPLLLIHARLTRYRERLERMQGWDVLWQRDTAIFAAQFERLYGEAR